MRIFLSVNKSIAKYSLTSYHLGMSGRTVAFVFSARKGNAYDFALELVNAENVFVLGTMNVKPCSGCDYECFKDISCPNDDDMKVLHQAWSSCDMALLFVPVYDGRPPSLFYAFLERLPSFWQRKEEGFKLFNKNAAIVVTGSQGACNTIEIVTGILEELGVRIIKSLTIDPAGLNCGGKIKGGLIENPEIKKALRNFAEGLNLDSAYFDWSSF